MISHTIEVNEMLPGQQPVIVLQPNTKQEKGLTAQMKNIQAGIAIADAVRSTLGPKGMDKMLVDEHGDTIITNDGVTILKEIDVIHPAAKMVIEAAKTQDDKCGDGTTTAVILAGELLKMAADMLNEKIHPTVIIEGYQKAKSIALNVLDDISYPATADHLAMVAMTSMTGKSTEEYKDHLASILQELIENIGSWGKEVDLTNLKILKKIGDGVSDTKLFNGLMLGGEGEHIYRCSKMMRKQIDSPSILMFTGGIQGMDKMFGENERDKAFSFDNIEKAKAFKQEDEMDIRSQAQKIIDMGTDLLFIQKGVDDVAVQMFIENNVTVYSRIPEDTMNLLTKLLGIQPITSLDSIKDGESLVNNSCYFKEVNSEDQFWVEIEMMSDAKLKTLVIQGSTEHVLNEIERSIHDALMTVASVMEDGKIVAGGGASFIEIMKHVMDNADNMRGRARLALEAFGNAMKIIPHTLAENAGLDSIDAKNDIIQAHNSSRDHSADYGLNVFTGEIIDMMEAGVIEPKRVARQAIISAVETAQAILRVDDVLSAGGYEADGMTKQS